MKLRVNAVCLTLVAALFLFAVPFAQAAEEATVLVLPFQVNAKPELEYLDADLPTLVAQQLIAKGLQVVPEARMHAALQSGRVTSLDLNTVRSLMSATGATAAVYGSFSQLGEAFSLDVRLVEGQGERRVIPISLERNNLISIRPAIEEIANRVANELLQRDGIAKIEVRGARVLDSDVVSTRIHSQVGNAVDPTVVDSDVRRIWDLGYFSDVTVDVEEGPEGLVLVYTVIEKPRIESISVEGSSAIDSDDILGAMSTSTGSVLNEQLLADDLQKVTELYRKKGYYLAQVTHSIVGGRSGAAAVLLLKIVEGEKLYIQEIKLEGATAFSLSDIEKYLSLSERGFISWITGSGVLKEELLERDSSAIAAFYMNNGFLDVVVGAAKVEYADDGIRISYPIKEGPRYRFGDVLFDGDLIDTDERLKELITVTDRAINGDYFDLSVVQEDARKLTDYYADYGYAFADIRGVPQKRSTAESVEGAPIADVVFHVDKQNKVFIRRVIVEGNTRTRNNVILRELRLADGDQFRGSLLRRSSQRLNKLGFFEVAETELVPTGNEEEVDLKVKIKEKPTGALVGGVGYSTYSQFGVSGTIMERNLWGKGYGLSFQAMFSGRRTAYQMSFLNPRLYDSDLSVGLDLYHWKDDFYDYHKRTVGGTLKFAYPLGEYTSLGWSYRLDQYKIYDIEDDASSLISRYHGENISSVLGARIVRDTTDREHPTTGTIHVLGVTYGGGMIGGDDDFITVLAEHQTYIKLQENHILHWRVRGTAIFENGDDDVPVFERFWMGGIDTVRGYTSRDLVPRDPLSGDRLGGTRMAFANFEYIWAVSPELGLNLVPFFDIGFNYDDNQDYNWSDEVKKSVGLELRWRSPMGDLRFAYGYPLDDNRRGERSSGRFEFSMGQFF